MVGCGPAGGGGLRLGWGPRVQRRPADRRQKRETHMMNTGKR